MTTVKTSEENVIMMGGGKASPDVFPGAELTAAATYIFQEKIAEALQYGPRPGYDPLRQRLVDEWNRQDGLDLKAEDTRIVTGAKQGLDMVVRALCSPGGCVIVCEPTYGTGMEIFRANGAQLIGVPNDEYGVDPDGIERALRAVSPRPKFIFCMNDLNNPTGSICSEERREKLVGIAERYGVPIVQDMTYRWLQFEGRPARPLQQFDRRGNVITVGTFSKILGPGMRVGWVHARKDILDRMAPFKSDGGTSPINQMLVYELFKNDGSLELFLEVRRRTYRRKRDVMLEALAEEFKGTGAQWNKPKGGYYVWLYLPGVDTDGLVDGTHALKGTGQAGGPQVIVIPGSHFYAGEPQRGFIRLAYSFEAEQRIRTGIRAVASALLPALRRASK